MSNDVLDRLRKVNPCDSGDVPPLTPEREALIIHAARTEFSGPLRRSWLAAAMVGLVLGVGGMAIWFGGGSTGGPVADGAPSEAPATSILDATEPALTATTLTAGVGPIQQLIPVEIVCSTQLNDTNFACTNLIEGNDAYWNDLSLRGEGAVITVTFAQPIQLEQVQFLNVQDDAAYRRNYRIRGVEIIADDLPGLPFIDEIPNDNDRPHGVTTPTLGTTQVVIRISSTWPAEAIAGRAFDELALEEIQFWGRLVDFEQIPEGAAVTSALVGTITETDWLGDHVYLAGYEALIVRGVGESCVAVVTGDEFRSSEFARPACTTQSGPEVSALAFRGFEDSLDTVFAGFVPLNGEITIQMSDETLAPIRTGQVWLFVVHNPDFANSVIADGHFVVTLDDVTIADMTIDGIQENP